MERLGAAEDGSEGLEGGAHDVVLGLLGGERGAAGLRVEAHHHRARAPGLEALFHDRGPETACGAELAHLLQQVVVAGEKEAEPSGEGIDIEAGRDGGIDVGDAVREREGDLLGRGAARFAHVVAGDGDGVPAGDALRAETEDVRDQPHAGRGRIDPRPAGDVLLENVVLDGAAELLEGHALLLAHGDVEAEEDGSGAVDGHGGGDAVEGNLLEQRAHVVDRVDGDADLADLAHGHGVVGVVADLGGEVEGDGEAGLALVKEVTVALVRFFGGAEAGVLAHGPETPAVHRGLDAAGEGVLAGEAEVAVGGRVLGRVDGVEDGLAGGAERLGALGVALDRLAVRTFEPLFFRLAGHFAIRRPSGRVLAGGVRGEIRARQYIPSGGYGGWPAPWSSAPGGRRRGCRRGGDLAPRGRRSGRPPASPCSARGCRRLRPSAGAPG